MAEFDDNNIPIECGECSVSVEGLSSMVDHILATHPNYDRFEAQEYARAWADSAYDQIDAENIERAEFFRRHGYDSYAEHDDNESGK